MRNLTAPARSPRSISRFRACWVVHAPVGLEVPPSKCTRRVSTARTGEPALWPGPTERNGVTFGKGSGRECVVARVPGGLKNVHRRSRNPADVSGLGHNDDGGGRRFIPGGMGADE